jgi:DNA-binding LytR/AlgR family response regulator
VPAESRTPVKKIIGRLGDAYYLIDIDSTLAFQAERELVWIITSKQKYLATQPLRAIQAKLAGLNFARVHRNSLVNLNHVAKMARLSSQRWLFTLSNQQEFIVSKRQAHAVQKLWG